MPSVELIEWARTSAEQRARCLRRPTREGAIDVRDAVQTIVADVRAGGDDTVASLSARFDGAAPRPAEIPTDRLVEAFESIDKSLRDALTLATSQIERFHRACLPAAVELQTGPGVFCERRWMPLDRVGLYVPGGTAPLVSTVLMLAIPARVAGVGERILCTPPSPDGVSPGILAAAHLAGVDRVFAIGGAQAVAAMAYGTESVPAVDKIFGPGNRWVTEAKQQCALDPDGADFDLPAGPSELLIVADASADAQFVAADLLSQAEHGEDSQVIVVATSRRVLSSVAEEVERQLSTLPRAEVAAGALAHARSILADDLPTAMDIANQYGPEHLILAVDNPEAAAALVRAAGSVFVGSLSPESAGDYASGTNHVLPTDGWARRRGGLNVDAFLRAVTFQRLTEEGVRHLAPAVERIAAAEGLDAHARAMAMRRELVTRDSR